MVHVHGAQAQRLVAQTRGILPDQLVAVPIDVGKHTAMALICDFTGELQNARNTHKPYLAAYPGI